MAVITSPGLGTLLLSQVPVRRLPAPVPLAIPAGPGHHRPLLPGEAGLRRVNPRAAVSCTCALAGLGRVDPEASCGPPWLGPVSVARVSAPHGAGCLLSFVQHRVPHPCDRPFVGSCPCQSSAEPVPALSSEGTTGSSFDVSKTCPWGAGEAVFRRPRRVEVSRAEKLGWEHSPVRCQRQRGSRLPPAARRLLPNSRVSSELGSDFICIRVKNGRTCLIIVYFPSRFVRAQRRPRSAEAPGLRAGESDRRRLTAGGAGAKLGSPLRCLCRGPRHPVVWVTWSRAGLREGRLCRGV